MGRRRPAGARTQVWAIKPKFAVNGNRSCAELAIVHHLRDKGWHGVWVSAYGPRELRSEWFPAPAAKTLAETGAPDWALRPSSAWGRERRNARRLLRCVRLAGTRPGQVRRGEGRPGSDQGHSDQVP